MSCEGERVKFSNPPYVPSISWEYLTSSKHQSMKGRNGKFGNHGVRDCRHGCYLFDFTKRASGLN
jgi:hypothetical protein